MKFWRSLVFCLSGLSLFLIANFAAAQSPQQFGYNFSGADSKGNSCSTGTQSFSSLKMMCLGMQNPKLNNDCALNERIQKFIKECLPQGFGFYESFQCKISLLKKDANFTGFGDFDEKDVLKSGNYCAGYTETGMIFNGGSINAGFYDKVSVSVDIHFVPKAESSIGHRSYANFLLKSYDPSFATRSEPLMEEFHYTNGFSSVYGSTRDGSYKYAIRCSNVWYCESEK